MVHLKAWNQIDKKILLEKKNLNFHCQENQYPELKRDGDLKNLMWPLGTQSPTERKWYGKGPLPSGNNILRNLFEIWLLETMGKKVASRAMKNIRLGNLAPEVNRSTEEGRGRGNSYPLKIGFVLFLLYVYIYIHMCVYIYTHIYISYIHKYIYIYMSWYLGI